MQAARASRFVLALYAATFLVAADARIQAQSATAPAAAEPLQPAPGDSHGITLDVQVTDKLGHHIAGLTAQDFTLLDNKQPAKIVEFREADSRHTATDPVQVLIVVDMINTGFTVVAKEREQLGEFLQQDGGRLAFPVNLAVLTQTGLRLEKASTTDGNALLAVLTKAQTAVRPEARSAGFYGATDRYQWSLLELSQLIAYEATQPGRKLAFFISPGWPLLAMAGVEATAKERERAFDGIVNLTNSLRRARLTLYAIDPLEPGHDNPLYYQTYLKGVSKPNDAEYPDLGLQVLATHSGGLVQVMGMDIKGELDNAMRDAEATYVLRFDAPAPDRSNEYHDLRLQVDKPGAAVRTTTGYYANPSAIAPH